MEASCEGGRGPEGVVAPYMDGMEVIFILTSPLRLQVPSDRFRLCHLNKTLHVFSFICKMYNIWHQSYHPVFHYRNNIWWGERKSSSCSFSHCPLTSSPSSSSVICQKTGPKPLAKRFLHIVRPRASSFNSQYPLLSLRSSSNILRLLPCLLVTSICPFIFPSITCFRRQFLRKI